MLNNGYRKSAIVTGANGFIGSYVTKELLESGYEVYAVVRDGHEEEMPQVSSCHIVVSSLENISELKNIIPTNEVDFFFHFACAGSIGEDRSNAKIQLQNVEWNLDALQTAKALGCKRFIFSSSIAEDESVSVCKRDESNPDGHYLYGASKFASRLLLMIEGAKLGIDVLWCKLANAYGVGDKSKRMLNNTLLKIIHEENPKFTSGTQNYDFVYVTDAAVAFKLIAEHGRRNSEYLIGSGQAKPLKDLLVQMQESVCPDLKFYFGDMPFTGINPPISAFDISKTTEDTGYRPKVSFKEGTKLTFDWLKDNLNLF